jgi:hypothetical protein
VANLSRRTANNPKTKPETIDSRGKPGITTVAVWVIVDVVWYGDIVATTGLINRTGSGSYLIQPPDHVCPQELSSPEQ